MISQFFVWFLNFWKFVYFLPPKNVILAKYWFLGFLAKTFFTERKGGTFLISPNLRGCLDFSFCSLFWQHKSTLSKLFQYNLLNFGAFKAKYTFLERKFHKWFFRFFGPIFCILHLTLFVRHRPTYVGSREALVIKKQHKNDGCHYFD